MLHRVQVSAKLPARWEAKLPAIPQPELLMFRIFEKVRNTLQSMSPIHGTGLSGIGSRTRSSGRHIFDEWVQLHLADECRQIILRYMGDGPVSQPSEYPSPDALRIIEDAEFEVRILLMEAGINPNLIAARQ